MPNSPGCAAILRKPAHRRDLLIFEIVAKIHRTDIERIAETVDQAIDAFGEVDILLVFAAVNGASLGAILDGDAARIAIRSNAHVRRYGVVGAPAIAKAMINLFDPLTPVNARTFPLEALDTARLWVDGQRD